MNAIWGTSSDGFRDKAGSWVWWWSMGGGNFGGEYGPPIVTNGKFDTASSKITGARVLDSFYKSSKYMEALCQGQLKVKDHSWFYAEFNYNDSSL